MQKQIEIKLMNTIREIEFEIQLNYEKCVRIEQLRNLMKIYKRKNRELYKRIQREYFDLIR
jgi:hypothetical protein